MKVRKVSNLAAPPVHRQIGALSGNYELCYSRTKTMLNGYTLCSLVASKEQHVDDHEQVKKVSIIIDCIDYVTGIGNIIQAPGHSVLRANTFSMHVGHGSRLKMANF